MTLEFFEILRPATAVVVGAVIGLGFGTIQKAALRRHELRQTRGKLSNGWSLMPGSFTRVALLMIALAAVQLVCPILFSPGSPCPWLVSAGVVIGYGWTLFAQLRRRRA